MFVFGLLGLVYLIVWVFLCFVGCFASAVLDSSIGCFVNLFARDSCLVLFCVTSTVLFGFDYFYVLALLFIVLCVCLCCSCFSVVCI